mgnify:CR=1 FL=1
MTKCLVLAELQEYADRNGLAHEDFWFTCDELSVIEAELGSEGLPHNHRFSARIRHRMPWPLYTLRELEEIAKENLPDTPSNEVLFYSRLNSIKPGYEIMLFARKLTEAERTQG